MKQKHHFEIDLDVFDTEQVARGMETTVEGDEYVVTITGNLNPETMQRVISNLSHDLKREAGDG